ncbi:hypothetical protein SAMN05216366_1455 [Selenomonas ruminantium]|uniref:Uncharacterized protein n=1 Tax=Selenomonas ruminantium TaxID=971 RepID=A0A1H0V5D6_SELRU|nr:hypothetical protein SAMN05216366_1455 [Selenomonas ruminantium]
MRYRQLLCFNHANAFVDMASLGGFVNHGDGVVGVADYAFPGRVQGQFLAAKDIFASTLALGLEIASGTDIRPLHIFAFTQFAKSLGHSSGKGLEHIREIGGIGNTDGMFFVHIQASGTANYQKAGVRAAQNVAKVLQGLAVQGECFFSLGTKGVNYHIKALEVFYR